MKSTTTRSCSATRSTSRTLGTFTVTFPAVVGAGDSYTVFGPCGQVDRDGQPGERDRERRPVHAGVVQDRSDGDRRRRQQLDGRLARLDRQDRRAVRRERQHVDHGRVQGRARLRREHHRRRRRRRTSTSSERFAPDDYGAHGEASGTTTGSGSASLTRRPGRCDIDRGRPRRRWSGPASASRRCSSGSAATRRPTASTSRHDGPAVARHRDVRRRPRRPSTSRSRPIAAAATRRTCSSARSAIRRRRILVAWTPATTGSLFAAAPQRSRAADLAGRARRRSRRARATRFRVQCGAFETDAIAGYDVARQNVYLFAETLEEARSVMNTTRESQSLGPVE